MRFTNWKWNNLSRLIVDADTAECFKKRSDSFKDWKGRWSMD